MKITITENKKLFGHALTYSDQVKVPTSYDELGPFYKKRKYRKAIGVGLISMDMMVVKIAIVSQLLKPRAYSKIDPGTMDQIIQGFGLFGLDSPPEKALVPRVRLPGGYHYFPTAGFDSGTAREWLYMNEYLEELLDGDIEKSYHLLALLARPIDPDKNGSEDQRLQNLKSRLDVDIAAQKLKKWYNKYYFARGVAVYYAYSMRKYIQQLYATTIFAPSDRQSKREIHFGWYENYLSVAETGVFGNIHEVMDTRFHDIAVHIITKIQDAKEMEANNKDIS